MSLIVFDIKVNKHPHATPPDFSKQYKKEETIKAKEKAWVEEGGWKNDPACCVITSFLIADPNDITNDIELPATENSVIQFVKHITSPTDVVVADDVTHKTCVLASTISGMITELKAKMAEKACEDDEIVLKDLQQALADLYAFKLAYIQHNFVYGNCHNLARVLKWDGLDTKVCQKMLGIGEDTTRLTVLRTLAERLGLK